MTEKNILTDEAKREFILALVHDLKNPIIANEKMIEMILEQPDTTTIGDLKAIFIESSESNKELLKMLDDFLAIYHCESGKFKLEKEKFDIKNMVEKIIREVHFAAQNKNLNFILSIDDNLPQINGGKSEMNRVLTNLISNAIKHGKNDSDIKIELTKDKSQIIFRISNYGEKLSDTQKELIFDLYKTAKNKLGQGLGLYISKKIIEMHKGKIWAETDESNKIIFSFSLPIK